MGCCGCSNKSSATTAGIFGLVQGGVGLLCNIYFLNLYTNYINDLVPGQLDDRLFLLYITRHVIGPLKQILIAATILHSLWILSSIFMLIGNSTNKGGWVKQWVIITSFVIIGDILLPIAVLALTVGPIQDSVPSIIHRLENGQDRYGEKTSDDAEVDAMLNYYLYYIIFVESFHKLGLITLIVNICLNVYTHRRANELSNPTGYVIGATVIIQNQTLNPGMLQVGSVNPGYPIVIQQGVPTQIYAATMPFQTDNFGQCAEAAPPAYEDQHGAMANPLRDDQKDLLLPKGQHYF